MDIEGFLSPPIESPAVNSKFLYISLINIYIFLVIDKKVVVQFRVLYDQRIKEVKDSTEFLYRLIASI